MPDTNPLIIRPARAEDKAAVLAFTQQTWDWGDYIAYVWDDWLADTQGSLIVGEVDGRVVGMDMMGVPRPGEGWFQGLRVDPAYRGQGIAARFEAHQIAVARQRGLSAVRLLTAETNRAVQKNVTRHGFQLLGRFLHHKAERDNPATQAALAGQPPVEIAPLATDAAAETWATLQRSAFWAASGGCLGADWTFAAFTPTWWEEIVAHGSVWRATGGGLLITNPFAAQPALDDGQALAWLDPGAAATSEEWTALAGAAARLAFAHGYAEMTAMLPRLPPLETGLRLAGWQADADADTMLLFELRM